MHASGDDDDDADVAVSREFVRARLRLLFVFLLLGYGVMSLLSWALVAFLRVHRRHAFAGDQRAARRVILPAFEPLLLVLAAATLVYSLYFAVALATDAFAFDVTKVTTELFYSGRQFVFLSVVVFMLQPSVSRRALAKSLATTLLLATYTVPIVALLAQSSATKTQFYVAHTAARAPLLLLYAYVFVKPPARASKQSLREFCAYAFVYYALLFAYNARFFQGDPRSGFALTYANLVWGSLCPLVIWRVLQADTEYWRRLGQRAVALQQNLSSSLSSSAAASSYSSSSRRGNVLALECTAANGAHVLVEMHRKFVIDFAYLELKHAIAHGRGGRVRARDQPGDHPEDDEDETASAVTHAPMVVYRGVLRGQLDVAVKVYAPRRLDEETIAQFAHEAALCGALRHPNVVRFIGLCVRPPTICMVAELCVGTLDDVTRAASSSSSHRQQLLVSLAHMLDAARAVAYLHSFTPPFMHRDISPASFLVDARGTVKLTDFGDSRSLPARRSSLSVSMPPFDPAAASSKHTATSQQPLDLADLAMPSPTSFSLSTTHSDSASTAWQRHLQTPSTSQQHVMTIKGTVEYMAPELLLGHAGHACYGEAADVFALAVTMWDILYPARDKYPLARSNRLKVFETVLAGERPQLGDDVPPALRELLTSAWHEDARLRPRADDIVSVLESLQEELAVPLAQRLMVELSANESLQKLHESHSSREVVAGSAVVSMLLSNGYVDNEREALRLGNALLDASVVHHAHHARPFELSDRETYYFDMLKIRALTNSEKIDPLARSALKRSRAGLSHSQTSSTGNSTSASSSSARSLLVLLSPTFNPGKSRIVHKSNPPAPKKALKRPPSAPVLSRRGRRNRLGQSHVSSDPAEILCACRKLSQRLQEPSKTDGEGMRSRPQPPSSRITTAMTTTAKSHKLRKVKSSPVLDRSLFALAATDDELPETDRMTDWEGFVLAIEDSEDEAEEDERRWERRRQDGLLRGEDLV